MQAPTTPLEAGLDLMRRLPPDGTVNNLASLLELAPELTEELLEKVDQPLQVHHYEWRAGSRTTSF
jgi:hypothetical protein